MAQKGIYIERDKDFSMRWVLFVFTVVLLSNALARVQTLEDMGVNARVGVIHDRKEWEIPYEFEGDCTPFFDVALEAGRLQLFDGNEMLLDAKRKGKYRVVLQKGGMLRIVLERKEGEREARLSKESYIACDKVPVVSIDVDVPKVWAVGGYTTVRIVLKNEGTADANGVLIMRSPWNAAPLSLPESVYVPARGQKIIEIAMITIEENNKVLFPRQCFKYGEHMSCVDTTTFSAEKNLPVECIVEGDKIELFNVGYADIEVGPEVVSPRDSVVLGKNEKQSLERCVIKAEIQKLPFEKDEDISTVFAVILSAAGVVGILASEKRLKTNKA